MMALLFTITSLAWDGETLYVARTGGVEIWREGRKVGMLGEEKRVVLALAVHGKVLAEAGGRAGERGEVRFWEAGKLTRTVAAHVDVIYRAAWSEDGKTLYTAGGDAKVGRIEVATGKVEYLEGHTGAVLALAVKGELVVSGGADRTIRVWKGGAAVRVIANHWEPVHALAFSPDGKYLASGSADRTVRIWQPEIGRLVRIVRDHEGTVLDLSWTEGRLASASSDGKVRLLSVGEAKVERVLEGHGDWVNALGVAWGRLWSGDASGVLLDWK